MNGYVDFHSELLPNVNKKSVAKTNEDAIRILNVLHKAKIKTVVATPYFLPLEESVSSFVERRDASAENLNKELEALSLPRVILGAEVLYSPSLLELPDIEKLCIGDTSYIMLALPYQEYSDIIPETLQKFIIARNLCPIIAHVEKYLNFYTVEQLQKISSLGVVMQLSCNAIIDRATRKSALELLGKGIVQIVGSNDDISDTKQVKRSVGEVASDIMNKNVGEVFLADVKTIPMPIPQYADAIRIMRYHLPLGKYKQIKNNAGMIISNASIKDIMSV